MRKQFIDMHFVNLEMIRSQYQANKMFVYHKHIVVLLNMNFPFKLQ